MNPWVVIRTARSRCHPDDWLRRLGDSEMSVIQLLVVGVDRAALTRRPFSPFIAVTTPSLLLLSCSKRCIACVLGVHGQSADLECRGARSFPDQHQHPPLAAPCRWYSCETWLLSHSELFQSPAFPVTDLLPIISYYSLSVCYWSVTWLALAHKEMCWSKF